MRRTLLITGATGTVSSALRTALRGADLDIRAMVRDPAAASALDNQDVRVVAGDLDDPRSLPAAFEGVDDLWLLVANGPRAPEHSSNVVWAARQAGVERVVRLSAIGAAHDAPTRSGRLHALSDQELQASGMRWTILRPYWFMQNLLNEAGDISARGTFSLNAGAGRLAMIDARDVGHFAARVLTDETERHDGRTYTLTGAQPLSFDDVARRFTRVLARPVEYLPVSDEAKRTALVGYGVAPWIADMVIEYSQAYAAGWGDATSRDFLQVTGHAPRDVEDFIRDHVAAFR